MREALEASREKLGDRHSDTLVWLNKMGILLQAKGGLDAAEALLREDLEASRETLGHRYPDMIALSCILRLQLQSRYCPLCFSMILSR